MRSYDGGQMNNIPFTQFLRPNGRQERQHISRSKEVYDKAMKILATGGRFTAEVLTTGEVSFAYERDGGDYAIEIGPNGPEIPILVDKLINDTYERLFKETK
jgi:hypothetical protein